MGRERTKILLYTLMLFAGCHGHRLALVVCRGLVDSLTSLSLFSLMSLSVYMYHWLHWQLSCRRTDVLLSHINLSFFNYRTYFITFSDFAMIIIMC